MEKIYYTQEGHAYLLRCVTKNNAGFTSAGILAAPPTLFFNQLLVVDNPNEINVNTSKRIIPVFATFAAVETGVLPLGFTVFADISTPFYRVTLPNGDNNGFAGVRTLSRMSPLIDRAFFTDISHFAYNARYEDVTYSTDDFINTSAKLRVEFTHTQANGMSNLPYSNFITFNPGPTYSTSVTFLYFELQA